MKKSKSQPKAARYSLKEQLADTKGLIEVLNKDYADKVRENEALRKIVDAAQLAQSALQRELTNTEQRITAIRRTLYNVLVQHRGVFTYRPMQETVVEQKMVSRQDPESGLVTLFIENYVRPEAIEEMRNRAQMSERNVRPWGHSNSFYVG